MREVFHRNLNGAERFGDGTESRTPVVNAVMQVLSCLIHVERGTFSGGRSAPKQGNICDNGPNRLP
jgi:hypothetical protein